MPILLILCDAYYTTVQFFLSISVSSIKTPATFHVLQYAYQLSSLLYKHYFPEAYSEPCQTSNVVCFAKIVNGFEALNVFTKSSILDVWQILNTSLTFLVHYH